MTNHEEPRENANRSTHVEDSPDQFISHLIRCKSAQVVRRTGFSSTDRDDVEQELHIRLSQRLTSFDATAGDFKAFVYAIVNNHVATILRDRTAKKRDDRGNISLSVVVGRDELGQPLELAATLPDACIRARLGYQVRSPYREFEMAEDVNLVLDSISDEDRNICERLKKDSISQVARDLGIERQTLQDKLRRLREPFEKAELKSYL